MSLEEVEKRYAEGYKLNTETGMRQWQDDMEWLMDEVIKFKTKYKNLMTAINDAMEENNKYNSTN